MSGANSKRPIAPESGVRAPLASLQSTNRASLGRIVAGLLLATLLIHALWSALVRVTDMDLWWTMAAGRYIVEHGAVPAIEVLSYTNRGAPWFNGEWLSQVIYYELYRHGGGLALVGYLFALVAAAFGLAAWIGWKRSGSIALSVAAACFAAYSCRGFFDIRAQLHLFLGALSLLAILEAYRRGARPQVLLLLPVVMLLWVNLHDSFLYGVGVLLLYAGCEAAKSVAGLPAHAMPAPRARLLAAAAVLAIAATLLNPYHYRSLTEPFMIVGDESRWRDEITEWKPPVLFEERLNLLNPAMFGYLLVAHGVALLAALGCDRRRVDVTDTTLALVTAVMALQARRFIPLFALVAAPYLAANVAIVADRLRWRRPTGQLDTPRSAFAALLVCVAAVGLLGRTLPQIRETFAAGLFAGKVDAGYFPAGAVEFLRLNPLPGRVYHPNVWGGYINFEVPERPMFIDGRAHTVYPWSFYLESQIPEMGEPGWADVLDRWQVGLIVWPSGFAAGGVLAAFQRFAASGRWQRIYEDGHSAVFAHVERGREWIDAYRAAALRYPSTPPDAQLFAGQMSINAKQFARAREQLRAAAASPDARAALEQAEAGYARLLQSDASADIQFGYGFYADVNGRREQALAAFRTALQLPLGEAEAAYAHDAVQRLSPAD